MCYTLTNKEKIPMAETKIMITTRMDKELYNRLRKVAKDKGMKLAYMIETGIKAALKEYEPKE
jgi:predicted DNA-binding protein